MAFAHAELMNLWLSMQGPEAFGNVDLDLRKEVGL